MKIAASDARWRRALAALLLAALAGCMPPIPHGTLDELYPAPPRPQLLSQPVDGRTLHYARLDGRGTTPILFIHGSPGDWKAWARFLDAPALAGYGARIAVDRPGYSESDGGQVMPDLRAQAALLAALIPDGAPAVVVGHSLGGPIAAWLALDHPDKVCGVVMVAGSVAGEYEAPRWYNRFAATTLGRWITPATMLWSNQEILPLQAELTRLDAAWPSLSRPLIALQGMKDDLVDPRTVDYLERRAPPAMLRVQRLPEQDHFLLWTQPQRVHDAIASLGCRTPPASTL